MDRVPADKLHLHGEDALLWNAHDSVRKLPMSQDVTKTMPEGVNEISGWHQRHGACGDTGVDRGC